MKRAINQGQAMRSIFGRSRVIHFIAHLLVQRRSACGAEVACAMAVVAKREISTPSDVFFMMAPFLSAPKPAASRQAPRGGQGNSGTARRFLESQRISCGAVPTLARF